MERVMLSVNIPFGGFSGSIWDDALDREQTQLDEYWDEDPERRDRDLPALAGLALDDERRQEVREALWDVTDWFKAQAFVAEQYAAEFADWIAETLDVSEIPFEYEEMVSPAFYNFQTDRLFGKFALDTLQTIFDRLTATEGGRELLERVIKDRHTSYDGFISFYDNDPANWLAKPLADWDHNELGTLIRAWAQLHLERDGETNLDMFLYDRSIGGLYEDIYRAIDLAIDWDRLAERAEEIAEEIHAEARERDPNYTPPPPRDDRTLPLPL